MRNYQEASQQDAGSPKRQKLTGELGKRQCRTAQESKTSGLEAERRKEVVEQLEEDDGRVKKEKRAWKVKGDGAVAMATRSGEHLEMDGFRNSPP